MELKTPLYDCHVKYGGKLVPFAGYSLPIQYTGLIAEHMAVRKAAGIFDVSHMTEVFIEGRDALKFANYVFSNDFTKMEAGRVRYTTMPNDDGGIVDDMVLYKESEELFVMVGNGSNRKKDVDWLMSKKRGEVTITDNTDNFAQIALQGPNSKAILEKIVKAEDIPAKYYSFNHSNILGVDAVVSQTGYTGEHGYEIYICPQKAVELYEAIMKAGEDFGLIPCGLGCRDTLRLEASMPLYGHEMSDIINPFEAGLGFVVKMDKEDFVGKDKLAKVNSGRQRVGIKVTGKGIAREECEIFIDGKNVGIVTSGTHAPFLGYPIAMGYVNNENAAVGTPITINVRGRMVEAEIIAMPFYKK